MATRRKYKPRTGAPSLRAVVGAAAYTLYWIGCLLAVLSVAMWSLIGGALISQMIGGPHDERNGLIIAACIFALIAGLIWAGAYLEKAEISDEVKREVVPLHVRLAIKVLLNHIAVDPVPWVNCKTTVQHWLENL